MSIVQQYVERIYTGYEVFVDRGLLAHVLASLSLLMNAKDIRCEQMFPTIVMDEPVFRISISTMDDFDANNKAQIDDVREREIVAWMRDNFVATSNEADTPWQFHIPWYGIVKVDKQSTCQNVVKYFPSVNNRINMLFDETFRPK